MPATLYFDLGSPHVYLAVARLQRFDFGVVQFRPVSLGALFKLTERSSWGLSPRREVGMAEIETRARAYGLPPIRWPDGWRKRAPRGYTDEAHGAGVICVPTLRLGERLFWGDDQLELAAAAWADRPSNAIDPPHEL